jgi:hypothetical protein
VLQGAEPVLEHFRLIKTEVADFEAYEGCARLDDIDGFLTASGYAELTRNRFASRAGGGSCFDVVYAK